VTGGRGEGLFDFIDPEDDRSHHLGLPQRLAQVVLRLAYVAVIEGTGVHAEEGQMPGGGDGLGAEALAGALNPQEQDTLGWLQAKGLGLGGEGVTSLPQPGL